MTEPYGQSPTAETSAPSARRRWGWPLVLVACGSLIPFLGFLIAPVALSWALLTDRPRRKVAIGLAAAGGALNFGGTAVLTLLGRSSGVMVAARAAGARSDLALIVDALERYHGRHGRYPRDLAALVTENFPAFHLNVYDLVPSGLRVPRLYTYRLAPDGRSYDLFSAGMDGVPYTADDIRPALPDSALAGTGYWPAPPP